MSADTSFLPETIGRFHIRSMLGRGAMGVVYLGHDEEIDRLVAIKLIRADLLATEERDSYLRRFRNEAKIAGRCLHANIVGLYDFAMHDDNPYLVMEYVNGVGLQQFYPRGEQRSAAEATNIALQVLDALHYAHGRSIVHRDIKPANILMMRDSSLKITDFGISRLTSMELTATPLLIGTPSYMSPEQCLGSELDGRNDLFSLGCVLYELVAGRRPFAGLNYTETIFSIVSKPHVPLAEIRPDLPPGFAAAIDRALSKSPADRFPDAASFARALDDIARAADLPRGGFPTVMVRTEKPAVVPEAEAASATIATPLAAVWGEQLPVDPPTEDLQPSHPAIPEIAPHVQAPVQAPAHPPVGMPSIPPGPQAASASPAPPEADQDATLIRPLEPVLPPARGDETLSAPPTEELVPPPWTAAPPIPVAAAGPSTAMKTATETTGQAELTRITDCLAEVIGPIAPLLVRRTVAADADAGTLADRLAPFVHRADERAYFLDLVRTGFAPRGTTRR